MSRFPNIPPSGDAASQRPKAMMVSMPPKPLPGAAAPKREMQPAQVPLNLTDKPDPADENTDVLIEEFLKDSHTLPKVVLTISALLTLGLAAMWGSANGGTMTGAFYAFVGLMSILIASITATGASWVVSKIFNEDFGSAGVMMLRFSAVAVAQFPVLAGLVYFLGYVPAMLVNVPIMIGVTIWVAGVDFFRAVVFSIIVGVVNLSIASFALMGLSQS